MGIPIAIGAAAITAAGSASQAYAQGRMNRKTRQWNEKMHNLTRQEALSDYAMQNEYNSPQAQMQRFRDAGLNPNLIYGQSNEGATVRSADTPSWNPRSPTADINPGEIVGTYFNTKLNEANLRNLETANTVQQQEAILKAAQVQQVLASIPKTKIDTDRATFDLSQAQNMAPYLLEQAQKNIEKLSAETKQLVDNNERQAALTSSSLQEAAVRIAGIRLNNLKTQAETANTKEQRNAIQAGIRQIEAAIDNLKKDKDIKEENLKLLRRGQNPNDPTWMRKLGEVLDKYVPTPKEFKRLVDSTINDYQRWNNPGNR